MITSRQRFSLTLQLDPRYEVIAYALALRFQGAGAALSQGLRPLDILILARDWWPDGFEISEKEFETLLQEMCGLGVLRKHRTEGKRPHYTFRNPNRPATARRLQPDRTRSIQGARGPRTIRGVRFPMLNTQDEKKNRNRHDAAP